MAEGSFGGVSAGFTKVIHSSSQSSNGRYER